MKIGRTKKEGYSYVNIVDIEVSREFIPQAIKFFKGLDYGEKGRTVADLNQWKL